MSRCQGLGSWEVVAEIACVMQEVYLRNILGSTPVRERDEAELSREQLSCDAGPKTASANCPRSSGARKALTRSPREHQDAQALYSWPLDTGYPERRGGPYSQGHSCRDWQYSQQQGHESFTKGGAGWYISVPHTEHSQLPLPQDSAPTTGF